MRWVTKTLEKIHILCKINKKYEENRTDPQKNVVQVDEKKNAAGIYLERN